MSKLFIYYSNSGNGDFVSENLKNKSIDIRKIETKYKLSKKLFFACMKGGFHAMIGKKPKLINFNYDISNYDEIIIGSPIWFDRFSCPINTLLKNINLDNKKITFVLYSGSGEAKKAEERINKNYPNAKIIKLKTPKNNIDELKKLEELQ